MPLRLGLGISMPTYGLPGIGASILRLGTAMASAMSFASTATLFTLMPGASCILNCITVGPTSISASLASMLNCFKAFIIFSPRGIDFSSSISPSCDSSFPNISMGGGNTPSSPPSQGPPSSRLNAGSCISSDPYKTASVPC